MAEYDQSSTGYSQRDETFEELVRRLSAEMNGDFQVVFSTRIDTGVTEDISSQRTSYTPVKTKPGEILICNLYENDQMTELRIYRQRAPAVLLKVLAQLLPSQYSMTKLEIKWCRWNESSCAGALASLLQASRVTELSLDGTCLSAGDYYLLLEKTRLRNLSLAHCGVDDQAVAEMMRRLRFGSGSGDCLETLNLTGNHLTDAAAAHIAEALKFNTTLLYLNLSGNYIGDEGGNEILGVLDTFQPPDEDMIECRKKYFNYLKRKQELTDDYNRLSSATQIDMNKKLALTKKSFALKKDKLDPKVALDKYLDESLGKFKHPYMKSNIFVKDDIYWCYGNRVLSYLNLAYNKLTFAFLLKLRRVLESQESTKSPKLQGLSMVIIEGNLLPLHCPEMDAINEILQKKCNKVSSSKYDKRKGK